MSLKFTKTPLSLLLAGCLVTAFSAQADIVIGVVGAVHRPERNLWRSILAWRYAGGGRH